MTDTPTDSATTAETEQDYPDRTALAARRMILLVIAVVLVGYGGYAIGAFPRIAIPVASALVGVLGIAWFAWKSPNARILWPWVVVSYSVVVIDILLIESLAIVFGVIPPAELLGLYVGFLVYIVGHWYATEARLDFLPPRVPQLLPDAFHAEYVEKAREQRNDRRDGGTDRGE